MTGPRGERGPRRADFARWGTGAVVGRWTLGTTRTVSGSGVIVCEGGGQLAVGSCLGEQRFGLGLERLHCIGARGKTDWRLFEPDERYQGLSELRGVATSFPIHTFPGRDDLLGPFGIAVNGGLSVGSRLVAE